MDLECIQPWWPFPQDHQAEHKTLTQRFRSFHKEKRSFPFFLRSGSGCCSQSSPYLLHLISWIPCHKTALIVRHLIQLSLRKTWKMVHFPHRMRPRASELFFSQAQGLQTPARNVYQAFYAVPCHAFLTEMSMIVTCKNHLSTGQPFLLRCVAQW